MKKTSILLSLVALLLIPACSTLSDDQPLSTLTPPATGWQAPDLTALAQNGQRVNIKHATKGPWAAVFFYPVADTHF